MSVQDLSKFRHRLAEISRESEENDFNQLIIDLYFADYAHDAAVTRIEFYTEICPGRAKDPEVY